MGQLKHCRHAAGASWEKNLESFRPFFLRKYQVFHVQKIAVFKAPPEPAAPQFRDRMVTSALRS